VQIRLPRRHVSTESQGRSRSQGHLPSHCSVKHLAWLTNLVIDSCDTCMSCRPVCVDSVVKLSSHLQVVSCWTVAQLQLCVFSVWCHLLTYSLTSQSLWSLCTFTTLTHRHSQLSQQTNASAHISPSVGQCSVSPDGSLAMIV